MAEILGYIVLSQAWYYESAIKHEDHLDEVCFGVFHKEEGGYGLEDGYQEVFMRWYELEGVLTPKLELWNGSFKNFQALNFIFNELVNWANDFSVDDFCQLLDEFGFTNLTERERRY
jgi:hypothetical protein